MKTEANRALTSMNHAVKHSTLPATAFTPTQDSKTVSQKLANKKNPSSAILDGIEAL